MFRYRTRPEWSSSARCSERIKAKAERSTPSGTQSRGANGGDQAFDHVALGGDDDHALARAGGRVDHAERVEVEHGVVERHRHLVLGLEAHGRRQLLAVGQRRQLECAQHGALVGDANTYALVELGVTEHLAQRVGERGAVEHLALAHRVGR